MKFIYAVKKYSYLSVFVLIIILFNLLLINLPLARVFGFEFSVLNSLLLVLLSGLYTISLLNQWMGDENAVPALLKRFKIASLLFLAIPVVISIANTLLGENCSLSDGAAFYIVITVPALLIGTSLALLSFFIARKLTALVFIAIVIIIALIPLFEFYLNPQVFFFNPLIGHIPGTIYDEGLSVGSMLVSYRFFNVLFFGGLLLLLYFYFFTGRKIQRYKIFLFVLILPAVFIYISPRLNYSTTMQKLKTELAGEIQTEHFSIHYSTRINAKLIKVIALHHEYYFEKLAEFFDYTPDEKIHSFIFYNAEQKGILFGSSNADVAKPWLMQIYTTYDNYNSTLKHEIAHCFTAGFGTGILKVADNLNPALIEGAATAASPLYDDNYIHSMAALAFRHNYRVNVEELFDYLNFFRQSSGLSYIYAGSFSGYLIDNYGISKFKALYSDIDFQAHYNKSVSELVKEYYTFLNAFSSAGGEDKATYYFGRKGIIQKDCPRYVYDRLETAWKFVEENKYVQAQKIFSEVLKVSNEYSALLGLAACLSELEETESSVQLILDNLEYYRNTSYYYNIEFKLADLFVHLGMKQQADSLYRKISMQSPNYTLTYLSEMRGELLTGEETLKNYLDGSDYDKYILLKKLNQRKYSYSSFPVLTDLSRQLNEDYSIFRKQFDKTFFVTDFKSSYGLYRISEYMLENADFNGAMRIAAFAARYNADENFNFILEQNFKKADWFSMKGAELFDQFSVSP